MDICKLYNFKCPAESNFKFCPQTGTIAPNPITTISHIYLPIFQQIIILFIIDKDNVFLCLILISSLNFPIKILSRYFYVFFRSIVISVPLPRREQIILVDFSKTLHRYFYKICSQGCFSSDKNSFLFLSNRSLSFGNLHQIYSNANQKHSRKLSPTKPILPDR